MVMEFREFVDRKQRKAVENLELVKKILEEGGFKVVNRLEEREDPYLFVYSPRNDLTFDGVRVYEIGGQVAYRIQKEPSTHPFGKAYALHLEDMFEDLLGEDGKKEEDIGQEIISAVVEEFKDFFEKSYEAEKKGPPQIDPLGKVAQRSTGTDYANMVHDVGSR